MAIYNRTLWFLIMILLSLLSTSSAIKHYEDLSDLRLDGSDTYDSGVIVLLFTQADDETGHNTTIHLRIILNDETVLPVEIDCSSLPNFIPKCRESDPNVCSLSPKALIEGYVLIESVDESNQKKQIIVSWDRKIHRYC